MSLRLVYYTKSKQKKQDLFSKKIEIIQKKPEMARSSAKEIYKGGKAFPCRIHGFVVY